MATTSKVRPTGLYTLELGPSLSYKHRTVSFHRFSKDGYPVAGVLTITEKRTEHGRPKVRRFAVQELPFDGGRRFKLSKPLGSVKQGEDDCYYVNLTPETDKCVCRGFEKGGKCSHAEIMRELGSKGKLPVHAGITGQWIPPVRANSAPSHPVQGCGKGRTHCPTDPGR